MTNESLARFSAIGDGAACGGLACHEELGAPTMVGLPIVYIAARGYSMRSQVASLTRRFPRFFGHKRICRALNSASNAFDAESVHSVTMRLGHRMKVDARSDTEMYALFAGEYDDDIISVLCSLISPGKNTVDVGANIGFYTVPFAIRSKALGTKVFAFEPVPSNFERLQENLGRNGVEKAVHLFQLGLSSRPGSAAITLREDFAAGGKTGNAALVINDDDLRFETLQVELTSLDVLGRSFELGNIGLMKVDIEGHEDEFLFGSVETISRNRPTIYMEIAKAYFARKGKSLAEAVDRNIPEEYAMLLPIFVRRPPTFAKQLAEFRVIRGIHECQGLSNILLCPTANLSSSIGPYRIDKARCSGDWRLSGATAMEMPASCLRGGALCLAPLRRDNFAAG